MDYNLITQAGVASLIFTAFMFLLKWVLKTQDKILEDSTKERLQFIETIRSFQSALDKTNEAFRTIYKWGDNTMLEHDKMLKGIDASMNALVESRKEHEKMIKTLDEQYLVLSRLNGK